MSYKVTESKKNKAWVKIKSPNAKNTDKKYKLLQILSKYVIYATKIITVTDGYIVPTSNEADQDKIFNNKTDQKLKRENLTPQILLELKVKRSVLIFKVGNHVFS